MFFLFPAAWISLIIRYLYNTSSKKFSTVLSFAIYYICNLITFTHTYTSARTSALLGSNLVWFFIILLLFLHIYARRDWHGDSVVVQWDDILSYTIMTLIHDHVRSAVKPVVLAIACKSLKWRSAYRRTTKCAWCCSRGRRNNVWTGHGKPESSRARTEELTQ